MLYPGVTVVIPSLGQARRAELGRALQSVAFQTRCPDAIHVSIDHERRGAWWAKQRGLETVTTEWTAFLDDDDVMKPEHIQRLMEFQVETGADMIYPWFELDRPGCAPDEDQFLRTMHDGELANPFGLPWDDEQAEYMRHTNFIPSTVLVRTSLAKAAGFPPPPNDDVDAWQDEWYFMKGLLDQGAVFAHLPERTWIYRHHFRNTSGLRKLALEIYGE